MTLLPAFLGFFLWLTSKGNQTANAFQAIRPAQKTSLPPHTNTYSYSPPTLISCEHLNGVYPHLHVQLVSNLIPMKSAKDGQSQEQNTPPLHHF